MMTTALANVEIAPLPDSIIRFVDNLSAKAPAAFHIVQWSANGLHWEDLLTFTDPDEADAALSIIHILAAREDDLLTEFRITTRTETISP